MRPREEAVQGHLPLGGSCASKRASASLTVFAQCSPLKGKSRNAARTTQKKLQNRLKPTPGLQPGTLFITSERQAFWRRMDRRGGEPRDLQARNHSLRAISAPGLERVLGRLGTDWAPPSGYVALIEEKVLAYFGRRRVATREYLVKNLGVSENDVSAALDALENRGWIKRGSARVIESPGLGVTILKLTPAGEQELERRRAPSPEDPVQRSRDEVAGTNSPPNSSVGSGGRTNKSRWNPLHTAAAFLLAVDRRVHDHD
jgi:hypothetical protein